MAKVKVFLSFEFDKDEGLRSNFYVQAARGDSCHEIENYSLKEPYKLHDEEWLKKAKDLISRSNIVIVVTGQDAHNAPGVKEEVKIANRLRKPIFQIRPQNSTGGAIPNAGEIIPWKWKKIDAKISECLKR